MSLSPRLAPAQGGMPAPRQPRIPLPAGALASVAYLVMAVLFTLPALPARNAGVLGYTGFENTSQTLWLYAQWKAYLFASAHEILGAHPLSPARLVWFGWNLACFPLKTSMANGLDFVPTLPLDAIFGFPAYFNVKCMLILAADAGAAYLLVRDVTGSRWAGFVGGAAFAFNPFTAYLLATGRIMEAILVWLPLYALFLRKTWSGGQDAGGSSRALPAVLCGASLGLAFATYWFYGYFLVAFTALFALCQVVPMARDRRRRPPLAALALAALVAAATVVPAACPYLATLLRGEAIPGGIRPDPAQGGSAAPELALRQLLHFSCDADYPVAASAAQPGSAFNPPWTIPAQNVFSLTLTLAAAIGCLAVTASGRFWWLALILGYLLPLGPYLKLHGRLARVHGHPVPLPYWAMIATLPYFDRLFFPNQGMALFLMAAAVVLGYGTARVERWHRPLAVALSMALLLGAWCEMGARRQLPLPFSPISVPAPYRQSGTADPDGFIYLPVNLRFWEHPADPSSGEFYQGSDLTEVDEHVAMNGSKALWGRNQYLAGKDFAWFTPHELLHNSFLGWLLNVDRSDGLFQPSDEAALARDGWTRVVVLERLCAHTVDGGGYRTDLAAGARRFETICRRLASRLGKPVYQGPDPSWDQGIDRDRPLFVPSYRLAIYRIPRAR